jgi:translation initiation factor IF-2
VPAAIEGELAPAASAAEVVQPDTVDADVTGADATEAEAGAPAAEEPPAAPQAKPEPPPPPKPIVPAGPKLVPRPASLTGPRVVRVEAPEPVRAPRPRSRPAAVSEPTIDIPGRPSRGGGGGRGKKEPTRDEIAARAKGRKRVDSERLSGERLREWRDQDLIERKERLASATGHGIRSRRAAERHRRETGSAPQPMQGPKTDIEIVTPIPLKDFCAAISVPYARLLPKLMEHAGRMPMINETIDGSTAEMLGLEFGITVHVVEQKSAAEELREEFAQRERENLKPRPPVVTMLGHVDHGKTSLLDAIRRTNVVKGEAGGITQHIGAHRIDRGDWHVTFLDTPGHQAFTEMRARGANLTDVVVLVVAADDGVMPQTTEAINHAKAAKVPIVIALNKIDLGGDMNKIYGQLAEQELTVSEWGGDIDVIKTSATRNTGIDELLSHLSALSELLELKADPTVPAIGSVIEAQMREGRGVAATVLIREGTLKTGQHFVCGPASGRVRSLTDSSGKRLKEAGPGTPVEISGLDELPAAGDTFYQVDDLSRAKRIAEQIRDERRAAALQKRAKPTSLEDLFQVRDAQEVPELNVIIKSDVDGSLEALRQELRSIPDDQVKLKVLHAAVGAVSEADVRLAEASGAIVIGFHVVADDRAQSLADEVGVEIRGYKVIYEVVDDIRKALEGLLEPDIELRPSGKAEVKQVFNLTKVGTVAGCQVTTGTIGRNNKVRVVRDGRIVRDGVDLASLKRFKNDVKEVASGYECGIKLAGFDDLKPGDIIEAYELAEVQRKL